jgi:hypothetical protein
MEWYFSVLLHGVIFHYASNTNDSSYSYDISSSVGRPNLGLQWRTLRSLVSIMPHIFDGTGLCDALRLIRKRSSSSFCLLCLVLYRIYKLWLLHKIRVLIRWLEQGGADQNYEKGPLTLLGK